VERGRRIAFDYGDVRIGVAVCDPDGIVCTPLSALKAQDGNLTEAIRALLEEYLPIYIAVGEPRHLSGHESAKMDSVTKFVAFLSSLSDVPIRMIDERLSTVSASAKLRSAGKDSRASKDSIDSAAAAEILEAALAHERIQDRRP
jgi:putative holliday junction resolvase